MRDERIGNAVSASTTTRITYARHLGDMSGAWWTVNYVLAAVATGVIASVIAAEASP